MRLIALLAGLLTFSGCTYYFGDSFSSKFNREWTPLMSEFEQRPAPLTKNEISNIGKDLLEYWANQSLGNWKEKGKVSEPRIMIAKLMLNRDIKEVNEYIQTLIPWGSSGSSWAFNRRGDYDFTEINLCNLVYLFADSPDKLSQRTVDYIIHELLIENKSNPKTRAPRTLGLMRDTENHILMKEITRYLKNQWIFEKEDDNQKFNERTSELEEWLFHHLKDMEETGLFEFDADPYIGYTITALLTLHAHTRSEKLKLQAQRVIDLLNWEYALGSHRFRKYSPFRRRMERGKKTELNTDPHTAMVKTWIFKYHNVEKLSLEDLPCCYHQALLALVLPYQIPDKISAFIVKRPLEYFVKIGHGKKSSPGIYSGDNNYLISAGGVQRGKRSQISARPISLILDDDAIDIKECFHATGKGKMKKWNNTGVYHRFAVNNSAFYIPDQYSPADSLHGWLIYKPLADTPLRIGIFNKDDLGLLIIFPEWESDSDKLAQQLHKQNPNPRLLYNKFVFPDGTSLTYDLKARKNRWVMKTIDGENLNRKFDYWPRIAGYIEEAK